MSREAMQIALDALEANLGNWAAKTKAVEVLRQALETEQKIAVSPGKGTGFNYFRALGITVLRLPQELVERHEPEPTAWQCQCGKPYTVTCISSKPPKQWVGLTDEEMKALFLNEDGVRFARYIESRLKDKNA
jgi:hypothetical protein